ncbi:MAG: endo-1,3-alpha-glucanase family glycosylhydrolase [Actinomycetota bacterium]
MPGRVLLALAIASVCALTAAPPGRSTGSGKTVEIQTVPALRNVRLSLGGVVAVSDRAGIVRMPWRPALGTVPRLRVFAAPGSRVRARFSRWYGNVVRPGPGGLKAAFDLDYPFRPSFIDLEGLPIRGGVVRTLTLRSSNGLKRAISGQKLARRQWLHGVRVVSTPLGPRTREIYYSVERALVHGSNVVNISQQRFFPSRTPRVKIQLLFYPARFRVRDLLFGFPTGSAIELTYPDGQVEQYSLDRGGVVLPSLPRGDYHVKVEAHGVSFLIPVSLSRRQDVPLRVVSYLDIGVGLAALAFLVGGLLLARRPRLRTRVLRVPSVKPWAALLVAAIAVLALSSSARAARPSGRPIPLLAHYYIWFDHSSWRRAKTDYPLLGRYSTDERRVMRQHVRWAKEAGIDGFIVSWKSTPVLNRRLDRLIQIADAENFKLAVVYQGLDFAREPLPAARVARDLDFLSSNFGHDRAFDLFDKPLVVWSGTWRFSERDVARVVAAGRGRLLILASEKNVAGYLRVSRYVDGNLYYWSSVNPETNPHYPQKLIDMGEAVHARGGLWIAPAAPGFDARLVGGKRVVRRRDGATLREEMDGAVRSSPDAVGLISWNEFSENTHLEPSSRLGYRALSVLGDLTGARFVSRGDFDSSDAPANDVSYGVPFLIGLAAIVLAGVGAAFWRRQIRKAVDGRTAHEIHESRVSRQTESTEGM